MDLKRLSKSIKFALHGMSVAARGQQNIKIAFIFAIINLILGVVFRLNILEWSLIILTTFFCISLETINMSLEKLLDMISPEYNGQTKVIKDVAAGAVFISAIGAAIIALFIYLPHIFK